MDPTETYAVFGESSTNWVRRIDLSTLVIEDIVQLTFNYSAEFGLAADEIWISAALGGFGAGNDIVRLDLVTGIATEVAHVAGPSGPLAFAPNGDLFYGTQSGAWPPPPDSQSVIRWDAAELAAGILLTELDADVVIDQLDGSSGLAYDPVQDALFVVDLSLIHI